MKDNQPADAETSDTPLIFPGGSYRMVRQAHRYFLFLSTAGLISLIAWAAYTNIDIVTRGSGQVEPSLQNQLVQHLEGGIVEEILVHEGQRVSAGDILMKITDSFTEAEYLKASHELQSKKIKLSRLTAESKGLEDLTFSAKIQNKVPNIVYNEALLFKRRQDSLKEKNLILTDQYKRIVLEKREKQSRYVNTQREFDLVAERVGILEKLFRSGAASKNELLQNQSTLQQIRTRLSDLKHQIPQFEFELSEISRRQTELALSFRSDAEAQRIEALRIIDQLEGSLSAMKDRSRRTNVRAPISGKIHRLFQTTIGGVVRGGQNLAQLVPLDAPISISIRLSPKDRGRVWVNLPAIVKLSAYDYSIYGGMNAKVTDISSDVLQDEDRQPYFRVKLEAETDKFANDNPIVAGMSAEVDIITGKRTILNYLLKPIRQIGDNALREG